MAKTNVITASSRIAQRFDTDYDRTKPPHESDERNEYRTSLRRALRYRYVKMKVGYRAEVVGPFHSAMYGTCSFGTKRKSAKAALQRRLVCEFGFIGTLRIVGRDESDTVGIVNKALINENASGGPIGWTDLVGKAGK